MEFLKRHGCHFCVLAVVLLASCSQKVPSPSDASNYPLAKRALELQKRADAGDASSQEMLGWMALNGMGIPRDIPRAGALFRKSAEQGNARAQRHMGHLALNGAGGDPADAIKWFQRSIQGGEGWAYIGLIDARRRAEGKVKLSDSIDMLGKAEDMLKSKKDGRSGLALYIVAKRSAVGPLGKGPEMDRVLAILGPAAEAGDADAQRTLGEILQKGDGGQQDIHLSIAWYEKAANQGDAPAQFALGSIFSHGSGLVSKNLEHARQWYEKAAALDHAHAQFALGQIFDEGLGTTRQSALAAQWYQRAAAQRFPDAQNNLGTLYATGQGVPKDLILAYAWYNLAAADGHDVAKDNRERVELKPSELEEAEKLSANWKVGQVLKR
ncbi:MAG: sel1 repeat family protein [Betaproteobacteria bacterium]|nr:sel1 repeat family protein [Betaproteobacteria bacterium]